MMDRARKDLVAGAVAATMVLVAGAASAAPDERERCAAAAEQGQQLRDEGKYRAAREQMLACARDVCPGPIKTDCGGWLTEIERDAPTVVFGAHDARGADLFDVRVSMDGAPVQERLDGKPVLVDPGERTFTFEAEDGTTKEERVLVRAGEKGRPIIATFGGAGADAAGGSAGAAGGGETGRGSIVPSLIVGGIGVAALGSFALFGISGSNAVDDLQKCKPTCNDSDVDDARTKLIIADVSLGVGIVALGVATFMFFTRPTIDASTTAASAPKLRFDAGPVAGGGVAGIGGSF